MAEGKETEETVGSRWYFLLLGLPNALLIISVSMTDSVLTDLIVYRTCLVSLNINATDCLLLRSNASSPEAMDLEAKVQKHASMIVMVKDLLRNTLPTVVSLLFVPWSDRGGRRFVLLAAFGGCTLSYIALTFMSGWNISPWYLIIGVVPSKLFGGVAIARIASVCYISDVTAQKDRTVQLTLLQAAIYTGQVLGALIGPLIYQNYGYTWVFGIAAVCCLLALAYTYFCLPESVKNASRKLIQGFGIISFVKGIVTMSSLKEDNFRRSLVWIAIFTLTLNKLIDKGYKSIEFLFTRTRLAWDVQHYSYFYAANTGLQITGLCIVSIRGHLSGVSDTLLIFMGLLSSLGSMLTKSLAWQSWHMYLSLCIDILGGTTVPVMRSVISKFIPSQDIGKIFSLVALLQALISFGGTPLYTLVYFNYLPPIYPSPVYLVSVGFYVVSILCVISMEMLIRKSRKLPSDVAAGPENPTS